MNKTISKSLKLIKEKLNHYLRQIDLNQKQITIIEERLQNFIPKNNIQYKGAIIFTKSLINLLNKNNDLLAKSTVYRYAIKKIEISGNDNLVKLSCSQLYEYISFVESLEKNQLFPYKQHTVDSVKRATRKLHLLQLRNKYWENIKLKNAFGPNRLRWKLRINNLVKNIGYYKDYVTNLRISYADKYIAGLVKRLEKASKLQPKQINSPYVIDLQNTQKYYNNGALVIKVLKDVNLQIKHGEFVVILGPSGSGKTTLLNIISGMDTASFGQTVVNNQNLITCNSTQLTKFRRDNVGYIFQQYGLLPNLTVKENVEIGRNLQQDSSKRMDIDTLLKIIGIHEQRNKFPKELSGGQQQRVSIARSMAKNPMLLFGDEPTGAIDEEMSKQIMQLFVDINKKYRTTVIIVTHNSILAGLATKVIKVVDGKISEIINNSHPKEVNQLAWGGY